MQDKCLKTAKHKAMTFLNAIVPVQHKSFTVSQQGFD